MANARRYTVQSEGDQAETIEAPTARDAAAAYVRGQDWRGCDEEVPVYFVTVKDEHGESEGVWMAGTGPDGFGQLREDATDA